MIVTLAIALADVPDLRATLSDCSVLAVGEASHGGYDEALLRAEITRAWVGEGDWHWVLEAGVAEGFAMRDALEAGDVHGAVGALGYFTWTTDAMEAATEALVEGATVWGMDVQTPDVARSREGSTDEAAWLAWAVSEGEALGTPGDRGYGRRRDRAMADAVLRVHAEHPGEPVVVWAHNGHVGRTSGTLGGHLAKALGPAYCAVALVVGDGEVTVRGPRGALEVVPLPPVREPSVEQAFANHAGWLDLRTDPPAWARQRRWMRQVGVFLTGRDETRVRLARTYDAAVWLPTTRATSPL